MSSIGVLAREHIPIWIQDWRSHDLDGMKDLILKDIITSFTVDEGFWSACLKSCGETTRNFRYDIYVTFVEDFLSQESVWKRPQKLIDNYPNIEEDDWVKFIQYKNLNYFDPFRDKKQDNFTNLMNM